MKKVLKIVRNVFITILLVTYFSVVIGVSTLLLSKNDYGYSQFGDRVLILMDEKGATDKYKEDSLVILKTLDIEDVASGQEIFIYEVDDEKNTINMLVATAGKTVIEGTTSPYVVLDVLGTSWGEDYIAGYAVSIYDGIGKYLSIIESKWVFFSLLIVPCFFILIYEIYLLIISIKYEDFGEGVPEGVVTAKVPDKKKVTKVPDTQTDVSKQLEDIQDEIFDMREEIAEISNTSDTNNNVNIDDNQKKIEELMSQVNKLKEEVASKK